MTADVRDLMALSRSLATGGRLARTEVRVVVNRGALNIKRDWRANAVATAGRHARRYPFSIGYDVLLNVFGADAEIGPDKGRPQGTLGNLLEYGSVHNPPHMDGARALMAERPKFVAQIATAGERAAARAAGGRR